MMSKDFDELDRIMPLKVSQGWAITYNSFFDENIKLEEDGTSIANWECYKEDLFQATKLVLKDGRYQDLKSSFVIDLGWYPDGQLDGQFVLQYAFVNPDAENIWEKISIYKSKDRFAIKNQIEKWMFLHLHLYKTGDEEKLSEYKLQFNKAILDRS